jgi:hypothetical protein
LALRELAADHASCMLTAGSAALALLSLSCIAGIRLGTWR